MEQTELKQNKSCQNEENVSLASFEDQMRELEAIVAKLESGKLNLQDSIANFERGHKISQACYKTLQQMEERIKLLDLSQPEREQELDI